jgi:hypothetical protein
MELNKTYREPVLHKPVLHAVKLIPLSWDYYFINIIFIVLEIGTISTLYYGLLFVSRNRPPGFFQTQN